MRGKITPAKKHRKETFKEVIEYVKSMERLEGVMIEGDHDQDFASIEVQHFFAELQLKYVHQNFNRL